MNKRYTIPLAWGLFHGINDWVAGYMITAYSLQHSIEQSSLILIIYTIIGFGGQLPVGMWIDRYKNLNPFINLSLGLLVASVLCFWINEFTGIVIVGLSSAFLHVTGGSICLKLNNEKAGPLGVFTAPGVLGLIVGIAAGGIEAYWLGLAIIIILFILLTFKIRLSENGDVDNTQLKQPAHQLVEGHDWLMLGILLTVTLRSLVYEITTLLVHNWQSGLLIVGICAFVGKIIGGFLADKIGWKLWVYITLPLAFTLLQFGQNNLFMLGFGIACLQSSVPISLVIMRRNMPEFPATSIAMTLGTAIALAALFLFVIESWKIKQAWYTGWGFILGLIVIAVIIFFLKRKKLVKPT